MNLFKQTRPFVWYHFHKNWFMDWDLRTWIFWKMSVTALATRNFKRSSWIVLLKGRFRYQFRGVQVSSQIVLHIFFLFVFSTCMATYLFSLSSAVPSLSPVTSFFTARVTPYENVTAAILSYAVSHLHEGTEKLPKTCADTIGHLTESVPSLTVSEKWPPAQRFDMQAADRRSPIQVLTQRKDAWLGWSPGTGHLPHTEQCR